MSSSLRLGDHCTKIGSGSTPSGGHKSYVANGFPLIRSQNVLMRSFSTDGLARIAPAIHEEMSGTEVQPGDVLLNITGASIGRVCVVPDSICPANVNQHVCIIRCGARLDPLFLMFYLSSPRFQKLIDDTQAGGTRQALTKADIENFEVDAPEIDKQQTIALALNQQLEAIRQAQAAARQQLEDSIHFQTKLRAAAAEKLACSPEIHLGDLIQSIETGKSIQTTEQLAREDQLGVLKVSAVSWGEFRANEAKATEPNYVPEAHHRVKRGDVIISRANTVQLVGAVVRTDRDYPCRLLSDKTLRLILDESKCDPDYIAEVMRLPEARAHIEGNATGTSNSMRNISQDTIRATPIRLPALLEQRRIARTFRDAENHLARLKSSIQQQLRDLDLLPQKLLAQVFDT
jgi:type I restriction enzyme, S subunit